MAEVRDLQCRVEELERRLYGETGAPARKVADGLVKVQVSLGNLAGKRERVKTLYKKTVPAQISKLQSLSQIHIQQQDQCDEISAETKKLLEDYNKLTHLLTKQFVVWNETLSKLEAAKQVKPAPE
ncbi:dynactin subunit 3 [Mantella aurantiaca]